MWVLRLFHGHTLKPLRILSGRSNFCKGFTTHWSGCKEIKTNFFNSTTSIRWSRMMSTEKGRGMRAKVEKRMWRESSKTTREQRRSKKIHKMLMTEEERLIYNLRRAKKKVALLLQKLKKYELPELPPPRHDPELLTPEQLQAYRKIGFRNRNYVPVGVRGVFGGVVQNMHLHWKFHETVQVFCDNFPKEKIKEMATMLARLSGGIVVNIHNVKTIIMFRGRNYRQPKNLIPLNTLTKRKALFKARFEQALESQKLNIKKIEQQLRRKGVNPEDPIAMASLQKVAATFFRAIDEKQGTPYVFRKDNSQHPQTVNKWEDESTTFQSDYSDQEELDKFIAEIEQAADLEWEKEEAAEKEEASRIRYWGRDEIGDGVRGRRSNLRGSMSEDEDNVLRRQWGRVDNRQRMNISRNLDDSDDNREASEGEEWESDDEIENVIAGIDSDAAGATASEDEIDEASWQDRRKDETWDSDDEEEGLSSESGSENGNGRMESKKKNFDESWDSD
ncbi:putative CRM domain-containing protein [Apostasia shenzhenica]|uniref:Putative CRM domain-containing protein n=1 Tax=Apostasia shenzhenica TaxID=1088818 RepID=A0A2I0AN79_9ASPA|nr:putative CRM domain-containing protein [Apostasia shenzhenica]